MSGHRAVLLSGSLGLGHEMLVRSCTGLLEQSGWETRSVDCMSLLGTRSAPVGQRVFTRMVRSAPALYDGLHFAHLRTGSKLAQLMGRSASARLVPALREQLAAEPPDLILSVFATGATAAAELKRMTGLPSRTAVLCTDVTLHRLWVAPGTDLFLATSEAAAASVRRYLPRAQVRVIPPPVRPAFYDAPTREQARAELELPPDSPCVLVIDSGWGFGSLERSVATMAAAGIHVLAVAGRQPAVEARFRALAARDHRVHAFGFVDDVPRLMAAADLVIAMPGATTCAEARVVDRPLLLLDAMPGHGRENLLHELEHGDAWVSGTAPGDVAAAARAALDALGGGGRGGRSAPPRWEAAFASALESIGIDLGDAWAVPDEEQRPPSTRSRQAKRRRAGAGREKSPTGKTATASETTREMAGAHRA